MQRLQVAFEAWPRDFAGIAFKLVAMVPGRGQGWSVGSAAGVGARVA